MTIEDTLTEFQKRRINERLNLDFNRELEKSKTSLERKNFTKNFRNQLDIFLTELYNDGVLFYGFTVSMFDLKSSNPDFWKLIHLAVEDWVNSLKNDIELLEFTYISIELDQKGFPFLKGILSIRSLIGNNELLFNEIKKIFNYQHLDCSVKSFFSIDEIKDYFFFIIKENNFKYHRFTYYSDFYESFYAEFMDLELQYDSETRVAFNLDRTVGSTFFFLKGINELYPHKKTIINYLVNVYMLKKNYFVLNNFLYEKMDDFNFKLVGPIDFLRENNILIFSFLKTLFPQQLNSLKISSLFNESWNSFYEDIKNNNHYLPEIDKKLGVKIQKIPYSNQ